MKKNIFRMLMVMSLLALVLVGCSSNTEQVSQTNNESNASNENNEGVPVKNEYVITAGAISSEDHSSYKSLVKFKELIEEKSDQRITVDIIPHGVIGGDREITEGVQAGSVTMVAPASSTVAQFETDLTVFEFPFLFTDREMAHRMAADEEIGQYLLKKLESKGFKALSYWDAGFRHLTNSKKEVKSLEDVKGLKVRVMSNPYQIATWTAMGANPTPIAFPELYVALQQGTVDGQEGPYGLIVSEKFYEAQKYLTTTGHVLNVMPVLLNLDFYNSLPADLQAAVDEAIAEATEYNYQVVQEEEAEARKVIEDAGIIITELTPEQKEEFKQASSKIYEEIGRDLDQDLVNKVLNFK